MSSTRAAVLPPAAEVTTYIEDYVTAIISESATAVTAEIPAVAHFVDEMKIGDGSSGGEAYCAVDSRDQSEVIIKKKVMAEICRQNEHININFRSIPRRFIILLFRCSRSHNRLMIQLVLVFSQQKCAYLAIRLNAIRTLLSSKNVTCLDRTVLNRCVVFASSLEHCLDHVNDNHQE